LARGSGSPFGRRSAWQSSHLAPQEEISAAFDSSTEQPEQTKSLDANILHVTPLEKEKFVELFVRWLKGDGHQLPVETDDLLMNAEINALILNHPVVVEAKRIEAEFRAKGVPCRMPF
jgi:hypothetical protein